MKIYLATGDALLRLDALDGAQLRWQAKRALAGQAVQCLAVDPRDGRVIYAGSERSGVWRSNDGGETWRDLRLPQSIVYSLAVSPADGALYAGCEPSMLFRLDQPAQSAGGAAWQELAALRSIPSAPRWSFPPRPWTSHVRWIAPNPAQAGLLLVGIELGGIMRTSDGGQTWQDHRPGAQRDVHALAWHPSVTDYAYEAGGGGAAWSHDAGDSWQAADAGRDRHYTWALAVDPRDARTWFISASTGPGAAHGGSHAQARIYRWRGEGPWQVISDTLAGSAGPLAAMPYALALRDGLLLAGLSDGRLFASRDQGDSWSALSVEGERVERVQALALVGDQAD